MILRQQKLKKKKMKWWK